MIDQVQHEAWLQERAGYLTASNAELACKRLKGGAKGATYWSLVSKVLSERLTHTVDEIPPTFAMQWGKDHEAEAAAAFEAATGLLTEGDGEMFIKHPTVEWLGASPDRFVSDGGLLEIKCPTTLTHIGRVIDKQIPPEYQRQMQVQILCTGRKFCYFADFDPRLLGTDAEKGALWYVRYEPSQAELENTLALCCEFLDDVQGRINSFLKEIA